MTNNQIQNQIDLLEKEMRELEPKIKKVPSILRVAIPGGVSLFCFLSFLYTLVMFFLEHQLEEMDYDIGISGTLLAFTIIFGILSVVGMIISLTGVPQFKRMKAINGEYNKLEDEKKALEKKLKEEAKIVKIESDEDTLLRLLSENKITLEEYKKLTKKNC